MAIGTTAAIIGASVLSAGATAIGASKNSKAISKASDAQTAANDQAVQAQRQARAENTALQRPLYDAGMPAVNARNALLGLGGQQQMQPTQQNAPQYGNGYSLGDQHMGFDGANYGGMNRAGFLDMNPQIGQFANFNPRGTQDGIPMAGVPTQFWSGQQPPQGGISGNQGVVQNTGQTAQQAANNAFDIFRNSSGYQFRLGEGMNALNSGWAGAGTLQSGAAMRAAQEYGQDFASNEFGNYMGMLGQQQNLATGAANALSGVNTTYANNAGNLAMANGQNLAEASIARANNSNMMLGSFANSLGSIAGSGIFGK